MNISLLYGISFALACVIFGVIIYIQHFKVENIFTFSFLIMLFVHFGYFALSLSTTKEEALLAYKITYLDGTIVPYLFLLCIMSICNLHNNKAVVRLSLLPIATYILGLSAGYSDLFYSNVEFHRASGYSYITRGYGPLHIVGTICLIVFTLAPIMPVVYAHWHRNTVSYKYILFCSFLILINALTYVFKSILGISIEVLPFQYNVVEVVLAHVIYKTSRHNIKSQAYLVKNRMKEYGFFAIDTKNRFLGCDDVARLYFPELEKLAIDTVIKDEFIIDNFMIWENYYIDDESTFKYFKRNDKDIKCRRKPMFSEKFGKLEGHIYEMFNDTENVKHVEELRQAVEEAEQANKSKSTFLSRMSHEIRTPINAIIGMNEVILRESKDKEIKPYSKTISSSAKMLLSLINDLLNFSKLESGKMELVEEEYEESNVLFNTLQMVQLRAANKDIELILETEGELPKTLYGDYLKKQEIILNFLTNGIKYTDYGTVTLKVSATDIDRDTVEMRYDIIDTGIGIKEEDRISLFEAFTRADMKRNNAIEGTGLGLSITSSYVEMMGGRIEVESVYGEGSVFTAFIPQKKVSNETIKNVTIDSLQIEEENEDSSKSLYAPDATVLVVDDNLTNLNVFKLLLEPTKIQITEASSGKQAIEILEKESFNIVFLDHMMPGMDGFETLKVIKERNLLGDKNRAVIALTANAIASAKEMYINNGFSDYISKPIDLRILLDMIAHYLPVDKYTYVEHEIEQVNTGEDISGELEKLPVLDEFDFEYAIRHIGNADSVKIIAKDVTESIPEVKKTLSELITKLSELDNVNKYQIEVHTMKSNSASIGALLLSKLCRLSEIACKEGNISKIESLHPILMEELDKHYDRLSIFLDNKESSSDDTAKVHISDQELKDKLERLKNYLEDWDYDSADDAVKELENYELSAEISDRIAEIAEEIHNFNGAYALDLIEETYDEIFR